MDILGIGGMELLLILVLMLVVAGPQRMLRWAYIAGQYMAKARATWKDAMKVMQKEFDDAGLDITLPTDIPTRRDLNRTVARAFEPVTRPLQETLDQARVNPTPAAPVVLAERAPSLQTDDHRETWTQPVEAELNERLS